MRLGKKRILVYWDYRRKDLLLPFDRLRDDFEWYFIFFRQRADDPVSSLDNRLYWSEFNNPYRLLKAVKPDAVIFSDLSNVYAVALNIASKNKMIKTYLLEHGVKLWYEYYIKMELNSKASEKRKNELQNKKNRFDKWHTLRFYLGALKANNYREFFRAVRLCYSVFVTKSDKGFANVKFSLRCPSRYLLFSRQNYSYYKNRDGISEQQTIYFGNPYQDDYVANLSPQMDSPQRKPYYLLLDDGYIEAFGISVGQKNRFIQKLNEFCLGQKCQLLIKLHPFDYGRTDLFNHENISYQESEDVADLIIHSKGCFAISTTLMLPLIPTGKVIVFRIAESEIQNALGRFGVKFLDYLNFDPSEIDFSKFGLDPAVEDEFIEQFLYKNDGKALERLKKVLEQ